MNFKLWLSEIRNNRKRLLIALLFIVLASFAYSLSGDYLTDHQGYVSAQDLILDHFGPYNLSFIFVWFFLFVGFIFFTYPIIFKPQELHYVLIMFSMFVIVRSGFIMFTHLAVPADAILPTFPGYFQVLNFANDLFFSGHTGFPFLGFLVFRKNKLISYFMLFSSILLGITVLLMHVHYSIDVFSAYFITYGIYVFGNKFVKK